MREHQSNERNAYATANEFIRKHKMEYTSIDVKNEMDTLHR